MKKLIFIILIPIFAFSNTIFPKEVAYVNIEKFTGLWYEIARTYNSFEEGCIAPTVEYTKIKADELKVQNRCFTDKIGGNLKSYEGLVKPLNKNSLSTLNKTYFWIFSKDYKIIYLDDYQTAIMSDEKLENIANKLQQFEVKPSGTEGYRTAEVTLGGVNTAEVSSKTMESKKVEGMHFIGESVDVTGHLGGYNFQWAWASGVACGLAV